VANAIETRYPGHVQNVNFMRGGLEIDIETGNAIIEVKGGNGSGLPRQIRMRNNPTVNPTGKVLIGYARDMSRFVADDIWKVGGIPIGGRSSSLNDLLELIRP
jgi:hypothetical protein